MNPDPEKDLQHTLHEAAQPSWMSDDAELEAALDDAAQTALPLEYETVARISREALHPRRNIVSLPTKPSRTLEVFWKIAAAIALLGAGFGTAWMMRAPTQNIVKSQPDQLKPKSLPKDAPIVETPKKEPAGPSAITPPALPSPPKSAKPTLLASTGGNEGAVPMEDKILSTKKHERSLHRLADDSLLWLDEETRVRIVSDREVKLEAGRAYVEVARRSDASGNRVPFVMQTPRGPVTALGTKFAVRVSGNTNEILVTEGKVTVPNLPQAILAGQWYRGAEIEAAPQAAFGLGWTRDLRALISPPPAPMSQDAGGALRSADGADAFALRRCHVDVYIEDGIARTTIDQTYFNHLPRRLEGTFFFPLPPDASISRLAMYVNGQLMEGGMAEREEARRTFESIKYKMQDPALLEWVDGSTFKMRVFPLEGREEKRIIISYTQRLDTLNGRSCLRVPVGHSLGAIGQWSFEARVKNGRDAIWRSASHDLKPKIEGDDLVLETESKDTPVNRDVQLEIASAPTTTPRLNFLDHEGWRYLALRWMPTLPPAPALAKRHWAFLVETSADRDAVLARTQREILKSILSVASADDTFSVVTAGTRIQTLVRSLTVNAANRDAVITELEKQPSIGALDLGAAFRALGATEPGTVIVHLGSATPVLGELENARLLDLLPKNSVYAGIAVGKRWNVAFARAAASRTGGWFTRINPDEAPGWRAFEFVSALNATRLSDIKLEVKPLEVSWLLMNETLAQGDELCALARVPLGAPLPENVELHGMIAGKEWKQTLALEKATVAGWLPRTWARLEIDRLVNDGAEKHHSDIVALSKASYVMSPFTSLLVLENDAMYAQYKVDRGRKDHWAMYACPDTMPVVREPMLGTKSSGQPRDKRTLEEMINTARQAIQSLESDYNPGFSVTGNSVVFLNGNGANGILNLYGFNQTIGNLNGSVLSTSATQFPFLLPGTQVPVGGSPITAGMRGYFAISPDSIDGLIGGWASQPGLLQLNRTNTFTGGVTLSAGGLTFNNGGSGPLLNFTTSGGLLDTSNAYDVAARDQVRARMLNMVDLGWEDQVPSGNGALILANGNSTTTPASGQWLLNGVNSYGGGTIISSGTLGSVYNDALRLGDSFANINGAEGFPSLNSIPIIGRLFNSSSSNLNIGGTGNNGAFRVTQDQIYPGIPTLNPPLLQPHGPAMSMLGDLIFRTGLVPQPPSKALNGGSSPNEIFLRDLTIYAAGFTTTDIDRLSVAEEALELRPGAISDEARALVERARTRNIIHRASIENKSSVVSSDGRFLHDERNIWGLREIIACDGHTLRHLYPEIGLATERKMSAVRWRELMNNFPWIVVPVEILALDSDVRCADSSTIEITPHEEDALITQLRFNGQGEIVERRLLNRKDRSHLAHLSFEWTKEALTLSLFDKDGQVLKTTHVALINALDEALLPDVKLDSLVVLPMPVRFWGEKGSDKRPLEDVSSYLQVDRKKLSNLILDEHLGKGDLRPGWYVVGLCTGSAYRLEKEKATQSNAIQRYVLAQSYRGNRNADQPDDYSVPRGENAFVDHLMRFRESCLWARTMEHRALSDLERAQYLSATHALADMVDAPGLVLTAMRRTQSNLNDPALLTSIAEFIGKVKQQRGDWHLGAAEADARLAASDGAKAAKLFEQWFEDSMKHDEVTVPGAAFHRAFFAANQRERYVALVKRGVDYLMEHQRPWAALNFAGFDVLDPLDAKELIVQSANYAETIFQKSPGNLEQAAGSLAAAQALSRAQRYAEALEYTRNAMTFLQGKKDADALLFKALGEFIQRKTTVLTLQKSLGQRATDNDERELSEAAAKLFSLSSEQPSFVARLIASWLEPSLPELARDYRTCPLAFAPNQSAPWMDFANDSNVTGHSADTEYAYDRAFSAEQTNADILLVHGQYLENTQRATEAHRFYEQIVHGTWGPNYRNAEYQAKQKLGIK